MPDKLTTEQFAAKIKQRSPELASVPDADLVRKVLERRPEMREFLVTEMPRLPISAHEEFPTRMLNRVSQAAEGTSQLIPMLLKRSREGFKTAREKGDVGGMAMAPFRAEASSLLDLAKGVGGVTTPGIIKRMLSKEDPASIIADAALMTIPSGRPTEVIGAATEALKTKMTPSIVGAHTRAIEGFRTVERATGDVAVDPAPVMEWISKAEELSKKGYQMPKVVADFSRWIEEKTKGTPDKIPGTVRSIIDQHPTSLPLTVKDAREFYTAMNEAIPWNEEGYGGKNGRMFYTVDKARQALHQSTMKAVEPYGMDRVLNQSMRDYARVARWRQRSYGVGWLSGKVAGYSAGYAIGHPLMTGYVGGQAGESLAGSMVRSVTEAGAKP
jgi:hypothetical protein